MRKGKLIKKQTGGKPAWKGLTELSTAERAEVKNKFKRDLAEFKKEHDRNEQ